MSLMKDVAVALHTETGSSGTPLDDQIAALRKDKSRIAAIYRRLDKLSGERSRLELELSGIKSRHGIA